MKSPCIAFANYSTQLDILLPGLLAPTGAYSMCYFSMNRDSARSGAPLLGELAFAIRSRKIGAALIPQRIITIRE